MLWKKAGCFLFFESDLIVKAAGNMTGSTSVSFIKQFGKVLRTQMGSHTLQHPAAILTGVPVHAPAARISMRTGGRRKAEKEASLTIAEA